MTNVQPPPATVVDTIRALLRGPWPVDEAQRVAWFAEHGIAPAAPVGDYACWGTGIPEWGSATTCWSVAEGHLVGVGWFLWECEADGPAAARELGEGLASAFGTPHPRSGSDGTAHWSEWNIGDAVVEFSPGTEQDARVQVHVVHARHVVDGTLGECATDGGPACC